MDKFLYRDHRGGLAESMETVREFSNIADIANHLECNASSITVRKYSYDPRIDWDSHVVCVDGCAVGFTNKQVDS